jgi:integrase
MAMPSVSPGCLYRHSRSRCWFIKFSIDGVIKRESTHTADRDEALAYLRRRTSEAQRGLYLEPRERTTFAGLRAQLEQSYRVRQNRSLATARYNLKHLESFFGGFRAEEITEERIQEYGARRTEQGAAPATLHRELTILKRMLNLCAASLPRIPRVEMPRVANAREGFFEESEVQRVLAQLPDHARNLIEFLYLTGWRIGEALSLSWSDVDFEGRRVTLRTANSKTRRPRVFPFRYDPRLEAVLLRQQTHTRGWEREHSSLHVVTAVFHYRGQPIGKLRNSWKRACARAGLEGRLVHDFRRTAVRNLIRAGVPQGVAMKITGHETDHVFRRYLIVDEEMLAQAIGRKAEFLEENR